MEELFKYKKLKYFDYNLDYYQYICPSVDYKVKIRTNNNQERQNILYYITRGIS